MKKLTLSYIKLSGWLEFIKFAIDNNIVPEDLDDNNIHTWKVYKAHKRLTIRMLKELYK